MVLMDKMHMLVTVHILFLCPFYFFICEGLPTAHGQPRRTINSYLALNKTSALPVGNMYSYRKVGG